MVVPDSVSALGYTALLQDHCRLQRAILGKTVTFLVEETSGGCTHACTVDDLAFLLSHVPLSDWAGLDTFVFQQPTRKTRLLKPTWGRLSYHARLGFRGSLIHQGPTVFVDAVEAGAAVK